MTIPTSSAVTELERLRDLIGMGLPHYLVPATTTTRRLDIECVPYVELRDAINDRLAVLRAQPATPEAAPPPAPEGTMPQLEVGDTVWTERGHQFKVWRIEAVDPAVSQGARWRYRGRHGQAALDVAVVRVGRIIWSRRQEVDRG